MKDMKEPPVVPQDYVAGVKVVHIEDLRVARGMTRREYPRCPHRDLVYCETERRVWCQDCEHEVDAFDAFVNLIGRLDATFKHLSARSKELKEAQEFAARSLAVKALDDVWRTRKKIPVCPHCREGLLPEDFKGKVDITSAEFTRAKRSRDKKKT